MLTVQPFAVAIVLSQVSIPVVPLINIVLLEALGNPLKNSFKLFPLSPLFLIYIFAVVPDLKVIFKFFNLGLFSITMFELLA